MEQEDNMDLVQLYETWLHDFMSTRTDLSDGWCAISTPFLDCDKDCLVVYVKREGDVITLSKDFYILSWLLPLAKSNAEKAKERNKRAIRAIQSYQITVTSEHEMVMKTDIHHFASSFHFFLRAMMAASDILSLG